MDSPSRILHAHQSPPQVDVPIASASDSDADDITFARRFQDIFETTSAYFHRLIGPFVLPNDTALLVLADHIQNYSLLACSDGSFRKWESRGCHAWVFSTSDGIPLLQGAGPIDGHPLLITSYRTELGGLTALLYLLVLIVRSTEIRSGSATIFCDNKAALEAVFTDRPRRGIYPLLAPDYDFISIAREMLRKLPIDIQPRWVKGHYTGDDRAVAHDLNALVDSMAAQFRKAPPRGYTPKAQSLTHSLQTAALISGGAIVTSKIKQIVYANMYKQGLRETTQKNTGWSPSFFLTVDWEAHEAVLRSYGRFKRLGIGKLVHGLWHTGAQKVLYGMDAEGLCPCCHQVLETVTHVYQCADEAVKTNRARLLTVLEQQLDRRKIPVPIRRSIMLGLNWFLQDPTSALPTPLQNSIGHICQRETIARNAYHAQTQLGWEQCLRGRLSRAWGQAIHYNLTGEKRDEKAAMMVRWIVKQLLQFSLALWEFRNGILHGNTQFEQRLKFTQLLRQQVQEAYELYKTTPTIVSWRNRYLFERRTQESRLQGDDDALLGWLKTVEVAMAAQEVEQRDAARNAERFFLPFREAGRLRIKRRPPSVASPDPLDESFCDSSTTITPGEEHSPSQKTQDQFLAEVPSFLQLALQRRSPEPMDLSTLFHLSEDDISTTSDSTISSAGLFQPSHFTTVIVDRQFSSDSSYSPVYCRDLPLPCDSLDTSSHSTISTSAYLAYRRNEHCSSASTLPQSAIAQEDLSTSSATFTQQEHPSSASSAASSATLASNTSRSSSPNSFFDHSVGCDSYPLASSPHHEAPVSEVLGMLSFLERRSRRSESPLLVTGSVPLPLSAETSGWMQQDSAENSLASDAATEGRCIPFKEQDDPPDGDSVQLP